MKKYLFFLLACFTLSIVFISCGGDDDDSPRFQDVTLSHGVSYTIIEGSDVTWTSSNELVAYVDGNKVTGICIGEAIISSSKGSFKVTVSPQYNNVTLPSMNFGASISTIKSEMSNSHLLMKQVQD